MFHLPLSVRFVPNPNPIALGYRLANDGVCKPLARSELCVEASVAVLPSFLLSSVGNWWEISLPCHVSSRIFINRTRTSWLWSPVYTLERAV